MKGRVYLETTIVSYLAAWPSRDLVMAANQATTREWWETRRADFELFTSQIVVEESELGDPDAAARRRHYLSGLPRLDISDAVTRLAETLMLHVPLPKRAQADAVHIAAAAVHGMHLLLTWNCTHIANAVLRPQIETVCRTAGYEPPVICTPQELLESEADDG